MATYPRTHVRTNETNVPLLRSGAAAPSGKKWATEKRAAVLAYVTAATEAGLPVDRAARGMVARHTGTLLSEGWELPAILRAIDRFARKRRMAGHLPQWCRENASDERAAESDSYKNERVVRRSMTSIAEQLRKAGLVA